MLLELPKEEQRKPHLDSPVSSIGHQLKQAYRDRSIFLALLSTLLWFAGLQGVMSNIGLYYEQFGLSSSYVGLVLMVAGTGSVFGSILGGRLSDKVGKRKVVKIASILTAIGVISVSAVTENSTLAIVCHILWAIVFGFGHAALTALISELNPTIRGTVLSLNSSAMYAGMVLASGISAFVLQASNFLFIGILSGVATLSVFPIIHFFIQEDVSKAE